MVESGKSQHVEILSSIFTEDTWFAKTHVNERKFCEECGRQKLTTIFMNDPWCGEMCRKSMMGEGPKRGFSEEWMERERKAGNIITPEELYKRAADDMRGYGNSI